MKSIFCNQVHLKGSKGHIVHEIKLLTYYEKGWYVQMTSLGAYQYGKKRYVPKKHKGTMQEQACYTEDFLYYVQSLEDMSVKPTPEQMESRIIHESLWDFYIYISWDYKKRKYIK